MEPVPPASARCPRTATAPARTSALSGAGAVVFPGQSGEHARAECPPAEGVAAASPDARRPAMSRAPLTGGDLYDWIALRRVSDGGIARVGTHWLDSGRRIPGYVTDTLTALCGDARVALAELDGWGMQRAVLTGAGTLRYHQLCQQRQPTRQLPAPELARTVTWLADHPHARTMVQSVWGMLTELEQAGHHPGALAALRRVLAQHQPTSAGRCRACRRWRWRRRRFPCIVWHQIHGALG